MNHLLPGPVIRFPHYDFRMGCDPLVIRKGAHTPLWNHSKRWANLLLSHQLFFSFFDSPSQVIEQSLFLFGIPTILQTILPKAMTPFFGAATHPGKEIRKEFRHCLFSRGFCLKGFRSCRLDVKKLFLWKKGNNVFDLVFNWTFFNATLPTEKKTK